MIGSIARKSFELYTAPMRFALRQTRRNFEGAKAVASRPIAHMDEVFCRAAKDMNIDLDNLSTAQREKMARAALIRAEYGITLALRETLKAAVLLMTSDRQRTMPRSSRAPIEGEYERVQ